MYRLYKAKSTCDMGDVQSKFPPLTINYKDFYSTDNVLTDDTVAIVVTLKL